MENATEQEPQFAFAYMVENEKSYTTGLTAILANSHYQSTDYECGEIVRLSCAMNTHNKIKYYPDGRIKIFHHLPSTEDMNIMRKAISRLGSLALLFFGESETSTYTPVDTSSWSEGEVQRYEELNETYSHIGIVADR